MTSHPCATLCLLAAAVCAAGCPNEVAAAGCKPGQRASQCKTTAGDDGPRLYVDPPFGVGFECITIGCDTEKTLEVKNRGSGTLRVSILRLAIDSSTDFTLRRTDDEALPTPDAPLLLKADQTITIAVRYAPGDGTPDHGALLFETSDGADKYQDSTPRTDEIPLTTRSLGDPILAMGTERLDFGFVSVSSTSQLALSVRHAGTQSVLSVGPITLDDTSAADFHEPNAGDWDVRYLNPGDEAVFPVAYTPTVADAAFGGLSVLSNDPVNPLARVELQGTAIAEPRIVVVEPVDGVVEMGALRSGTARTRPITVMNLGGVALDVSASVSLGGQLGLSVGAPSAPSLGALRQATFDVTLAAGPGGPFAGAVRIASNDPNTPVVTLPVEAQITEPVLTATPSAIDFGNIVLGWTADARHITLDNTGVGELTITGVDLELGSSSLVHLADVPGLPIKLSPDEEPVTISVFVTGSAIGRADAVVLLHSDSVDNDVVRVNVTGNVVTCDVGCPMPHGVPDCSTGRCEVGSCAGGFHNADESAGNGCECQEDVVGNVVDDLPQACPGLNLGGHSDNDGDFFRSGTLHSLDDIDLYFYTANDDTQFLDDEYGARVTLEGAPAGMIICANFQDNGSGCGGAPTNCSPNRVDGHGQSGIFGGSDNSEDVTVWVMWAPGAEPQCGSYTVRFATDDDM